MLDELRAQEALMVAGDGDDDMDEKGPPGMDPKPGPPGMDPKPGPPGMDPKPGPPSDDEQ